VGKQRPEQDNLADSAVLEPITSQWWSFSPLVPLLTGALWLIGLGLLFVTNTFWPGVLVLAGLTAYITESARGRHTDAVRGLVTLTGMAVLFRFGLFWPWILIVMGVVALLSPELRGRRAV